MISVNPKVLKAAAGFVSKEQSRGSMTRVLVEVKNHYANIVASDAYRIFWHEFKTGSEDFTTMISGEVLNSLINCKVCDSEITQEHITFFDKRGMQFGGVVDTVNEGKYFNWRQLIPETPTKSLPVFALNPDYVASGCKAIKSIYGKDCTTSFFGASEERKPLAMVCKNEKGATTIVVMPIRTSKEQSVPVAQSNL